MYGVLIPNETEKDEKKLDAASCYRTLHRTPEDRHNVPGCRGQACMMAMTGKSNGDKNDLCTFFMKWNHRLLIAGVCWINIKCYVPLASSYVRGDAGRFTQTLNSCFDCCPFSSATCFLLFSQRRFALIFRLRYLRDYKTCLKYSLVMVKKKRH